MEWLCAVFALERWSQLRRWRCGGCCCWWCCECVYTHTHFSEYLPLNAPTLRLSSLFSLNNCALVHNSLSLSGAGRRDNIVVSVRAGGKECKVDSFKPGAESGVHRVILVISRKAKEEGRDANVHTTHTRTGETRHKLSIRRWGRTLSIGATHNKNYSTRRPGIVDI